MKKIIVTGALGHIGSALIRALPDAFECEIIMIDNLLTQRYCSLFNLPKNGRYTFIEQLPEQSHRPRPWGKGNNPKTALDEFMATNDRFSIDMEINNKILFSNQPGGYLICTKD